MSNSVVSIKKKRIALFLYNMGGPTTNEDVPPFLEQLFSDNDIIDLPGPYKLQTFIAGKIARKRSVEVGLKYGEIGGGSPQLAITMELAEALKKALINEQIYKDLPFEFVYIGPQMRYTAPRAESAFAQAVASNADEIWLLSQYPHCSRATTGTSLREFGLIKSQNESYAKLPLRVFAKYGSHPDFLDMWAARISVEWEKIRALSARRHLIVSAHSLPVSYVAQGDPYRDQILSCAYGVMGRLGLEEGRDWTMAWQSAVGPVRWLSPDTRDVIRDCAKAGLKNLLIWPIAFVSDHIETLHEIDIEFRDLARDQSIEHFSRVPNLNTEAVFTDFLTKLILKGASDLAANGTSKKLRDLECTPSGEGCHLQTGGCLCGRYFTAGLRGLERGLLPARLESQPHLPPKN